MRSALGPLALLVLLNGCAQPEAPPSELVVEVKTGQSRAEPVESVVGGPAMIFPRSQAQVASRLTAPIERLEAGKGDAVRKGQLLATLSSRDLEAQRIEASAQVEEARANLERVTAGSNPSEAERARGQVEVAAAELAMAQRIYQRRQALFAEGAIPERELLLSKTQYEQATTAHRVAEQTLELLTKHSGEQDARIAQSRLDQARARLSFIETQLGYARIVSPSDGVITEQFLYPGDMAKPDSPVFTVMDLAVVVARGEFPEAEASAIREGQSCWFEGLDAPGVRRPGRTTVVNQAVDPSRRTVQVWCEIPNRDSALRAGAFGQAVVVTALRPEATTVPVSAVEYQEGSRPNGTVWVVGSDGRVHGKRVRTGVVSGDRVEVREGLDPGETVIVEGGFGLAEGMAVRAATAEKAP